MRFIVQTHGIRGAMDAMSRYIIGELDKAGIGIASSTCGIVGFPPDRAARAAGSGLTVADAGSRIVTGVRPIVEPAADENR